MVSSDRGLTFTITDSKDGSCPSDWTTAKYGLDYSTGDDILENGPTGNTLFIIDEQTFKEQYCSIKDCSSGDGISLYDKTN
jgi:hypothetical protein